jgi:hypothetical protein
MSAATGRARTRDRAQLRARVADLEADRNRYRDALLAVGADLDTFYGTRAVDLTVPGLMITIRKVLERVESALRRDATTTTATETP